MLEQFNIMYIIKSKGKKNGNVNLEMSYYYASPYHITKL